MTYNVFSGTLNPTHFTSLRIANDASDVSVMDCRQTPFANGPSDTPSDILARIGEGSVSLTGVNWDSVSSLAKELVARMLDVDPRRRISLQHVLQHRWITLRHQLPQLPQMRIVVHDAHLVKVKTSHDMI